MSSSASFPNSPNNENAEWPNEKKYTNSPPPDLLEKYHECPFCSRNRKNLRKHIEDNHEIDNESAISKLEKHVVSLLKLKDEIYTLRHYLEGKGIVNQFSNSEYDEYLELISML